jgi:hypothetical protein
MSSLLQSLQESHIDGLSEGGTPDYESIMNKSIVGADGTNTTSLAQMIAGIEDRYKASTTLSQASRRELNESLNSNMMMRDGAARDPGEVSNNEQHMYGDEAMNGNRRDSVVGGTRINEMSFEEQCKLLAPERLESELVIEGNHANFECEIMEGGNGSSNLIDISERSSGQQRTRGYHEFGAGGLDASSRSAGSNPFCSYAPTLASAEDTSENVIVSSVDWSSLSKSCKRAKNAFRDADSGQMVVKNMFTTHLSALTTVLTLYAKKYCGGGSDSEHRCTLEEIKSRTTETKRALRFAMASLTPPRVEDEGGSGGDNSNLLGVVDDSGVENYRIEQRHRQELQELAVKGMVGRPASPSFAGDSDEANGARQSSHYGLQIPLVEIIHASKPWNSLDGNAHGAIIASIEKEKRTVRVLAARMLCNLVTDNPLAAEIVLNDVPFSRSSEQLEVRRGSLIMGSRERVDNYFPENDDGMIFWTDLIAATAKLDGTSSGMNNTRNQRGGGGGGNDDGSQDREELSAVAAALHNLLTSLESRESLLELDDEMKRRENLKNYRMASRKDSFFDNGSSNDISEEKEGDNSNTPSGQTPIDVGFEVASNAQLMNSLLRNILSARAVLIQAKHDKEHMEQQGSFPKFKPPSASTADDLSDSATEWISLILERLASRGLLQTMLQSAGGTKYGSVTPEQVVLISCIRQAVDDYHCSLTAAGEIGEFGRRRLSIAAKTVGMTVTTRPHPLWGRADISAGGNVVKGRDSRTAVPVLLCLANEVEEIRLRLNALHHDEANELYDGEQDCTRRMIDDLCDILAQSLGRHAPSTINGSDGSNSRHCILNDARSVLGRETPLIASCCNDLASVVDAALARNSGRNAREMTLSPQEQQTAIVMVRLVGNIIYQCRYNQDMLRITPVPMPDNTSSTYLPPNSEKGAPMERTGLHVILSATSLAPACFTLREWCIVAIRNAVEGNAANTETVRRLEANQVLDDTPELNRIGVKIEMDAKGNVQVKRKD